MEKINSINIFKAFFKTGLILLGGGYVIVPVMEDILIKKRNWITSKELIDFYSIAQSLPGIIAINISILVANKLYGLKGAIVAVFALSLSPVISIIAIAKCINYIINIPFIESIFWGVNLAVIILIYLAVKEMWAVSMKNTFCYVWFFIILFLSVLKLNPVYLISGSIIFGILLQKISRGKYE